MTWLHRAFNARSRAEMAGLEQTDAAWQIVDCVVPASFFRSLPLLVGNDAVVQVEGGAHAEPLRLFLSRQAIECEPHAALGTVWPASSYFCIPATIPVLEELAALTASLPGPEVCDHLHVFVGPRVLVSGYDAFSDPFYISGVVPEGALADFCRSIGCRYEAA